jgi:hypothetical protein
MKKYKFLEKYISTLPREKKVDYSLEAPIHEEDLSHLESKYRLELPNELKELFRISYTPKLDEYQILTIPDIANTLVELENIYEELWDDSFLPFAYVIGVGDYVAFNLSKEDETGIAIVDCFHELPPSEWKEICFGLENWLLKMVETHFRPYWM